jgi:glycosyltransferase involved in cell wall biosynthesis
LRVAGGADRGLGPLIPTKGPELSSKPVASIQRHRSDRRSRYKIAMLAPPWIAVPPPGYGGIELVVGLLCEGLVDRGHDVILFAAPGSRSSARVREVLPDCHPEQIGGAFYEVDHVSRVFAEVEQAAHGGQPFDVIHDHSGFSAVAMGDRIATPVVHTLHGPFTDEVAHFYTEHADKTQLVAISETQRRLAPPQVPIAAVIHNPINVADWPLGRGDGGYLLWAGRFTEEKGPHRAIAAARAAATPLVLAGPVQPGQEDYFHTEIEPHVDGRRVRYVGETGGERKRRLFAGARGLLMPIRWDEPFGMVMVEALACGTPVIAFPEGAAVEIVQDGLNGYLVDDEDAMAAAVARLARIRRPDCRTSVQERFDLDIIAAQYETIYQRAAATVTSMKLSAPVVPIDDPSPVAVLPPAHIRRPLALSPEAQHGAL